MTVFRQPWNKGAGSETEPTEAERIPPSAPTPTRPTLAQQSLRALAEFGLIVNFTSLYEVTIFYMAKPVIGGRGNHGWFHVHGDGGGGAAVRPRLRKAQGVLQLSRASP